MKGMVLIGLAAACLGGVAGAGMGYFEARPWQSGDLQALADRDVKGGEEGAPAELGAEAIIPEDTYRFGKMESGTAMTHDFEVRNEGVRPLSVSYVNHTCKCTAVRIDGQEVSPGAGTKVAPGEATTITLEWVAKTAAGPFRHGATFATNDPSQARFELVVDGDVVESTTLSPSQIYFDGVRIGESREESLLVMSFMEPTVEIKKTTLYMGSELQDNLQVRVEPVAPEEFPDPSIQAAARVFVALDAKDVVGPFQGTLEILTNLKQAERLAIPIGGAIKGDISLYGSGWRADVGLLKMGPIASAQGGASQLNLMIRGEHAATTQIEVGSITPAELQVELGERLQRAPQLVQIPMKVFIPPGTAPMVRAGEDQGGEGEIVLTTTHPTTSQVKLRVQFAVKP
jgi:hypothetical protein